MSRFVEDQWRPFTSELYLVSRRQFVSCPRRDCLTAPRLPILSSFRQTPISAVRQRSSHSSKTFSRVAVGVRTVACLLPETGRDLSSELTRVSFKLSSSDSVQLTLPEHILPRAEFKQRSYFSGLESFDCPHSAGLAVVYPQSHLARD